MRVLAVPVKRLPDGKSRLAPLLAPAERAHLTLALLEDVLTACVAQAGWQTWVVSRDPTVLGTAVRFGARPVPEEGGSLLQAVRQVEAALAGPADQLAVVLGDLPLLTARALAAALHVPGRVVAAPAVSDGGTNLLLRRPPSAIPARFGPSSFARHRAEALRAGAGFRTARMPELGFDLDRPDDVRRLIEDGRESRTRSACLAMGLAGRVGVDAGGNRT